MVTNVQDLMHKKKVYKMNIDERRRMTFPLRLAISLKDMANILAQKDGVSLNHFISLAVAEKISRLESETLNEHHDLSRRQRIAVAADVIHRTLYSWISPLLPGCGWSKRTDSRLGFLQTTFLWPGLPQNVIGYTF
jgi:hypothetical protein